MPEAPDTTTLPWGDVMARALVANAGKAELIAIEAPEHAGVLESAQVIWREAHCLARLIDDLLLLDRTNATELAISRTPIDLNAVIADDAGKRTATCPSRS